MDAGIAGLIGAIIGASALIIGQYLPVRLTTGHKRRESLHTAVVEGKKSLAAAVHQMVWLSWAAKKEPKHLLDTRLAQKTDDYHRELHRLFPVIAGNLIAVASLDQKSYRSLSQLRDSLFQLDENIAHLTMDPNKTLKEKIDGLATVHDQAVKLEETLLQFEEVQMSGARSLWQRYGLLGMLLTLFVVPIVVALLWYGNVRPGPHTANFEFIKMLFQVGLVSGLGTIVSLLVANHENHRENIEKQRERERENIEKQRERERENRRDVREMHAELLGAYNRAKAVRRHLRAATGLTPSTAHRSIDPNIKIAKRDYRDQTAVLNDAQLVFETYAKRANDDSLWFSGVGSLAGHLSQAEKYLNGIIGEYEENFSNVEGDPHSLQVSSLKHLSDFLIGTNFDTHFVKPTNEALRDLGKVVLQ